MDPAAMMLAAVGFWGTVLGGGFYFARRWVRAVELRAGNVADLVELRARVDALEEALVGTRRDVERLDSGTEDRKKLS